MRFLGDDSGATAIEYGLIAALLAVIVIVSISFIDDPVSGMFGGIAQHFNDI